MHVAISKPRPSPRPGWNAAKLILIRVLAATALPLQAKERGSGESALLFICADARPEEGIAELASEKNEARFARIDGRVSLGIREEALWFRLELPPRASGREVFLRSTYMDGIRAYISPSFSAAPGGYAEKDFAYGIAGYSLDPGDTAERIYFRVQSDAPVKFET